MESLLLAHVLLFAVSAALCLGSIPRARTIQHQETREGLLVFLLSVAIWSVGYVGYLLAPTNTAKLVFYIVGFTFAFAAVAAWLYFCAAYTGRSPKQAPFRSVFVAVFLFFAALKITNPLHHLYFTTEWTTDPFPHLAIQHQLLYWILLGLSYAVIAVGFFMLIERLYYTGSDSRPLMILAGVTGVPAIATILGDEIQWLLPLMYEPPGVALFAVGTLFVYKHRFEAIRLTAETDKPAIYLDHDTRIRDYNQSAQAIFPDLDNSIGKPIQTVSPTLEQYISAEEIVTITRNDEARLYDISRTPFISGNVATGQLVTLTDVTDRESYRQRLEEKTEQLEALNRVVRHDIRNDMAVILGWAQILEDHVGPDGKDALERVLQKSRHVIELTDISRDFIESLTGDDATEMKSIELRQVLDAELDAVRDSFPDAEFVVSNGLSTCSVRANEMLSSVFRNILENAVRHNDEQRPTITVSCVEQPRTVLVRIADNGPGISDDRKEQIFGKGAKSIDSPGTGIGLYLVETLMRQFGGDVWVEDRDPKGAVFVVELQKAE